MAATLWQKIDMQASDGGLCFREANAAPSLSKNIEEVQQCITLRDFATSFTEQDYVDGFDTIWKSDVDTKDIRAHRGRLHSAWRAASTAITKLEETPKADGSNGLSSDLGWEAPFIRRRQGEALGGLEIQVLRSP